jgi:hypothetical protein
MNIKQFFYKTLFVFVVCFWVVMMGFLFYKEFLPKNISSKIINIPGKFPYKCCWSVYSNEKKIGFFETDFGFGADGYVWKNFAEIKFLQDVDIVLNAIAFLDEERRLNNFKINLAYNAKVFNIDGIILDDMLKVSFKNEADELRYTIPWKGNLGMMDAGVVPLVFMPNLKVGEKFNWYLFNPLTRSKELVKAVVRRSSFYYNKKDFIPVVILDMYYQNMHINFWIDNEGNPLKIETPYGWELRIE